MAALGPPRRGGGEGAARQGAPLRGGQQEQLLRRGAAHEHPHADEKESRRVAEPTDGDARGIDSREKCKLIC